ncbi:MAG: aconitate hydratase AcnA [Coxiellaceae bacterium]|nr:aconitate hydratase AcnA [Coxiellaceae bacterium]
MSNSYDSLRDISVNGTTYHIHNVEAAEAGGLGDVTKLPFSLKILLENILRHEDGEVVTKADADAFAQWLKDKTSNHEIAYHPARVLMQDFTGVPAVVDLAAMRDAIVNLGSDAKKINPLCPVDLVIDHSVQIDKFGTSDAFSANVHIEMERNNERYQFLKWGQKTFDNFRVVPPGTGICHQVNLEYLAHVVRSGEKDGKTFAYPDTCVGTDSHTTMINGIGVLGWGVGGIEAEAAILGQPISMLIPEVIGFRLEGKLREGITATDLVLTCVQMLREKGVVGKFVEFFGSGLQELALPDRATIGNMAPEYGATCGLFPIDKETIRYMELSGRDEDVIALTEVYAKATGTWHDESTPEAVYTDTLHLDLNTVVPSVAGPKRPQDRVALGDLREVSEKFITSINKGDQLDESYTTDENFEMHHGDIVIAAITSCTNTSNPSVMIAAGLLAQKASELGMQVKPWVKTSLAPGSKVVTDYLHATDLMQYLEKLGFYLAGYGCTTCIGNSGPLPDAVTKVVTENDITANAVLSGNRNFEGRIHPLVKANWLASPPLVVAYALAGTTRIDLSKDAIGTNKEGEAVYLKDVWPSNAEVAEAVSKINRGMFREQYANVFDGDEDWQAIEVTPTETYSWDEASTYVRNPPYFDGMGPKAGNVDNIEGARILALFADSVTTDHISPAGSINPESPAGQYLREHDVKIKDFNSYGSRRGNHEVMMRGTFANIRIRNEMVPGVEGGFTKYVPTGEQMPIYDAAMKYKADGVPSVVIAGKEYGTGSSRDWAAKGPYLQGVKAVLAESYERIHRSNLIGMGILPLEFKDGVDRKTLKLTGNETVDIPNISGGITPKMDVEAVITREDGSKETVTMLCRIDTANEAAYYTNGGILQFVLRNML